MAMALYRECALQSISALQQVPANYPYLLHLQKNVLEKSTGAQTNSKLKCCHLLNAMNFLFQATASHRGHLSQTDPS